MHNRLEQVKALLLIAHIRCLVQPTDQLGSCHILLGLTLKLLAHIHNRQSDSIHLDVLLQYICQGVEFCLPTPCSSVSNVITVAGEAVV